MKQSKITIQHAPFDQLTLSDLACKSFFTVPPSDILYQRLNPNLNLANDGDTNLIPILKIEDGLVLRTTPNTKVQLVDVDIKVTPSPRNTT